MAISQTLYSSRSEEWPTPNSFFAVLDKEFAFSLDPCATSDNTKCRRYFTKKQNGQDWGVRIR
jgi:site-specific DNA-methyltransferase (adenine-specific)